MFIHQVLIKFWEQSGNNKFKPKSSSTSAKSTVTVRTVLILVRLKQVHCEQSRMVVVMYLVPPTAEPMCGETVHPSCAMHETYTRRQYCILRTFSGTTDLHTLRNVSLHTGKALMTTKIKRKKKSCTFWTRTPNGHNHDRHALWITPNATITFARAYKANCSKSFCSNSYVVAWECLSCMTTILIIYVILRTVRCTWSVLWLHRIENKHFWSLILHKSKSS